MPVTSTGVLNAVEHLGEMPDVIAHAGGYYSEGTGGVGAGYLGVAHSEERPMNFLGRKVTLVSVTHERSHIHVLDRTQPRGTTHFSVRP